jgi:hypothetical protein
MVKSRIASLALAMAGMWAQVASAATLDVNLSDDTARLAYAFPVTDTGLMADFAVLHHDTGGDLFSAGLHLVDDAAGGTEPFTVGLGGRLYAVDTDGGPSGSMLAIGAWGRYVVPQYNRFVIGASLHYAPSVISFGDADGLLELSLRGEYRVLKRASVGLGWRRSEVDFDLVGSVKVESGAHLSLNIEF